MHSEINLNAVCIQPVGTPLSLQHNVQVEVLRLDLLHPVISGNKWFKLRYYLEDAQKNHHSRLLTFGGAYSNHIVASAYAAKLYQFQITGVIRGEEPVTWSHTLREAKALGMQLHFLSRSKYNLYKRNADTVLIKDKFGKGYIIPEGGIGPQGVKGIADWLRTLPLSKYTVLATAVGTGTTLAGLVEAANVNQQVIGFSAMKNNYALSGEIETLLNRSLPGAVSLIHDYHFGGYAKFDARLISWMNEFYATTQLPLDFVYTGKMMFGIFDLIAKGFFAKGSKILAIHTGGLQGNASLPPGTLTI